jgi:hypothetical protein
MNKDTKPKIIKKKNYYPFSISLYSSNIIWGMGHPRSIRGPTTSGPNLRPVSEHHLQSAGKVEIYTHFDINIRVFELF